MRENPYEGMSALAYFGRKLKEFREKAGLSQAALAKELNYSDGLVAMVETARRSPSREFAILTDRVLKTKTEGVLELLWYVVHNSDNRDWYPDYVALEASAIQIDYFSPTALPGLLQTEAYAREIVNAGWVYGPEAAERRSENDRFESGGQSEDVGLAPWRRRMKLAGADVVWRMSSRSGNTGECVEVAALDPAVGVRDSKGTERGHLVVPSSSWAQLLRDLNRL